MAYVGTPSFRGNNTLTLASIIDGEAGHEGYGGMTAVAAVIQNRANVNLGGYGGNVMSQALAPNQFQGQVGGMPSPQAIQVATDLQNGRISDPTGGALYYANPSNSSGPLSRLNSSNSLQIGNHYFSDNYGPASQSYLAQADRVQDAQQDALDNGQVYTAMNGAAPAGNLPTFAQSNPNAPSFPGAQENLPGDGTLKVSPGSDAFGTGGFNYAGVQRDTQNIAPAGPVDGRFAIDDSGGYTGGKSATSAPDPVDADPHDVTLGEVTVSNNGQGSGSTPAPAVTGQGPAVAPVQPGTTQAEAGTNSTAYAGDIEVAPAIDTLARSVAASAQSQNAATASASNALKEGLGDVGKQISTAGQTTASATTGLASTVAQSTDKATSTAQDIKTTAFSFASNMFVRVVIVIVGAIFLAAALRMFTGNSAIPEVLKPGGIARRAARIAKAK